MAKIKADLHMHTRASDGTLTPEELIKEIKDENIELFAITDHDTIDNIKIMKKLAKDNGVKFIPGVEISSIINGQQFHILAYNFDETNEELNNLINNNARLLNEKDNESIKMLIDDGFNLDYEEFLKYEYDPVRGGWKTLNFLIDKGVCNGVEEFFSKVFIGHRALQFPGFPHPRDVIKIIKDANGIAILAHPRYGKSKFTLEETLKMFSEWGIDGVECSHPHHDEDTINFLIDHCNNNKLIITGGSDYHGGLISKRSLGTPKFYTYLDVLDLKKN